ncbi:unnamed protein product, partial [Bubo scandiacus]
GTHPAALHGWPGRLSGFAQCLPSAPSHIQLPPSYHPVTPAHPASLPATSQSLPAVASPFLLFLFFLNETGFNMDLAFQNTNTCQHL